MFRKGYRLMEKVTITRKDVTEILGIGQANADRLLRMPGAPVIRVGRRLIIPKEPFLKWVDELAIQKGN
jgi:hypothetical protein